MRYIQNLLNFINSNLKTKIRIVWLKYEEEKTAKFRFIRKMNKFECMIQAYEYERKTFEKKNLEEFQKLSLKINFSEEKAWLKLLQQKRQTHFSQRKRRVSVIFFIDTFFQFHWFQILTAMKISSRLTRSYNALFYVRNSNHNIYHWMICYVKNLMIKRIFTRNSWKIVLRRKSMFFESWKSICLTEKFIKK